MRLVSVVGNIEVWDSCRSYNGAGKIELVGRRCTMKRGDEASVHRKRREIPVEADSVAEEVTIPDYVMLDFVDDMILPGERRGLERVTESS